MTTENTRSVKKLALWGYGGYGRSVEAILSRYEESPLEIAAVFDRRFFNEGKKTEATQLEIRDPDTIKSVFDKGVFDEVLIAVYDPVQNSEIHVKLQTLGIPACSPDEISPSRRPDDCDLWEPPRPLQESGYVIYSFRDHYIEILPNRFPFISDKTGLLDAAFWHEYQRRYDFSSGLYRADLRKPAKELEGEWCSIGGVFGTNYWHFTFEALAAFFVMERSGFRGMYLVNHSGFTEELLKLAGADLSRFLWYESLETGVRYHFEKLLHPVAPDNSYPIAAPFLIEGAKTIKNNLPPVSKSYPERVFVKRIASRKLIVAPETLDKYGFHTIIPEELSVSEQIRYFEQAKIVLSPHGANTTNSLYMREGTVLIETFPNTYINPVCLETLALQGVYYLPIAQRLNAEITLNDSAYADYKVAPVQLELAMNAAEKLVR